MISHLVVRLYPKALRLLDPLPSLCPFHYWLPDHVHDHDHGHGHDHDHDH
jgi:hypothetical protein